ncbi:MAG: hypothetical protein HZA81_00685 [Candidatus Taylorbacteria bacterium]|nr:hypothetical protein [Candidatus Taylorbacteria bacterium]
MTKYTKKHVVALFGFALVAAFAAPQAADAAWWNPLSWFRKPQKEIRNAPPAEPVSTATSSPTLSGATTTPVKSDDPSTKPLPAAAKPPVTAMPVQAKPVVKAAATTTATATPPAPATKPAATTTVQKKVEVPSFSATYPYLPSNFSQPKNIRQGTELLAIEAVKGEAASLGLWYVDSVTWRVVSEEMRSGDLTIGVSSKQNLVSDSNSLNASITTKLVAHAASDELSFKVNGPFPDRGRFHIVVEEVTGHMKNDESNTIYTFKGLPIVGSEFSL